MLDELLLAMEEVEENSEHDGYLYRLQHVLIVMILGLLCRNETIQDVYEWSQARPVIEFLKREFNISILPKRTQFYKILSYANHEQFAKSFQRWAECFFQGNLEGQCISIDGKQITSTSRRRKESTALHIASAVIATRGIIISSKECVHNKSSEVGVFRDIISSLNVKGALILCDALHCKPKSAQIVIENGADYLFVVKNNNKNLRESVELHSYNKVSDTACTVEKNGGRIETRTAYLCDNIERLYNKDRWQNISCVGAIHREFEKNDKKSSEWHYYISSKKLTAEELLRYARQEWSVESVHWLLDVHFREDHTKVYHMEIQRNLNVMRKIIVNFIKEYQASLPKPIPMSRILHRNLLDTEHLATFLAYFRRGAKAD